MSAKKNKRESKHINLLPREDFDRTTLGRILKWSLTTFRYIVIMVELIVVAGFLSRFYFDVRISDLNDEIKQQSAVINARAPFENDFRNAQLKLSVLSTISDDSNSMLPIINKVSSYMSSDMKLEDLSKEGVFVIIKVTTLSDASMNNFVNLLIQDPGFEDVTLNSVEQESGEIGFTFTVQTTINFDNIDN